MRSAGRDPAVILTDRKKKTFYSRKYGLSHIRYMHHRNNILHASTRLPSSEPADAIKANAIRYHSTHDNKYLMYFHGHTARYVPFLLSQADIAGSGQSTSTPPKTRSYPPATMGLSVYSTYGHPTQKLS